MLPPVASLITTWYSSTREGAGTGDMGEQMAQGRRDRRMSRIIFPAALFAASLLCITPAAAQVERGRAEALDYLGRGTAAFHGLAPPLPLRHTKINPAVRNPG
jgi:hypothetical protein